MYSEYMTVASPSAFKPDTRFTALSRRAWVATLCVLIALGLATGCASQQPTADPPSGVDEMSAPEVLHHAAVSVFEEEVGVDIDSQKQLLVASRYESLGDNMKRRYTAEVIRGPEGVLGLKVTVDFKRRYVKDEESSWIPYDNAKLREQARPREVQMGRAIERRFEAWTK